MKKFKFLFLAALIAVMFIGCAQPTDDTTPIISSAGTSEPEAQPTVKESKSFQILEEIILLYKDASVTYSDGRVDKYKITTIPKYFDDRGNSYQANCIIKSLPKSTIDFFNGVPIIIEVDGANGNNVQIDIKFSEIYTKID